MLTHVSPAASRWFPLSINILIGVFRVIQPLLVRHSLFQKWISRQILNTQVEDITANDSQVFFAIKSLPFIFPLMSSDLQSVVGSFQMNNYISRMVKLFLLLVISLTAQYSCHCYCCHIWLWWTVLLCMLSFSNWNRICNPATAVLTFSREVCYFLLHNPHTIGWQHIKVDYVWVGKQQLSSKDWVSYSLVAQILDLGLHNICSGMCI